MIYTEIIDGVDGASVPDGHADEENPTTTYGLAKAIVVGVRAVGIYRREYRALALYALSLQGIVDGALISTACLRVNVTVAAAGSRTAYLRRITPMTPTIAEATFTWNNRNLLNAWGSAGFDYTTDDQVNFDLPTTTGLHTSSELKGLVQYVVTNKINSLYLAWMLASNSAPDREIAFSDRSAATPGNRPTLCITWTPPLHSHYQRLKMRRAC